MKVKSHSHPIVVCYLLTLDHQIGILFEVCFVSSQAMDLSPYPFNSCQNLQNQKTFGLLKNYS